MRLSAWMTFLLVSTSGCSGLPDGFPSSGQDVDRPTSGDDDPGGEALANTGTLIVHGEIDGNPESCRVPINLPLEEDEWSDAGATDEEIVLESGEYVVCVGDARTTHLSGVPLHRNDVGFWIPDNWGTFEVRPNEVTEVTLNLELLRKYRCESWQCPWPYEGQECDIPLASSEQWITVQDGVLRGSDNDCFGGQCGVLIQLDLKTRAMTVEGTDVGTVIVEQHYNAQTLDFSYLFENSVFEGAALVSCEQAQ